MRANKVGNKYGKLTVLSQWGLGSTHGEYYWLCHCDCGNVRIVRGSHLKSGNVKSCGCLRHHTPTNSFDFSGSKYGELKIIRKAGQSGNGEFKYLCKCSCGKELIINRQSLIVGTGHCGCKSTRGDNSAKRYMWNTYHNGALRRGLTFRLSLNEMWKIMQKSCYYCNAPPMERKLSHRGNPKSRQHFFANGIDRVDNTKGYTSDNCVPCCAICNLAKSKMSLSVFEDWAVRVGTNIAFRRAGLK
jgi:hypothetical protein